MSAPCLIHRAEYGRTWGKESLALDALTGHLGTVSYLISGFAVSIRTAQQDDSEGISQTYCALLDDNGGVSLSIEKHGR